MQFPRWPLGHILGNTFILFASSSLIFFFGSEAVAQKTRVPVKAYTRKDGTYVRAHTRGCPGGVCGGSASPSPSSFSSGVDSGALGMSGETASYERSKCVIPIWQMERAASTGRLFVAADNCHVILEVIR